MATTKTSNAQVAATMASVGEYLSQYSGEEVDNSVAQVAALLNFINDNVITPARSMTGDFLVTNLTTLTRDMWLESIVLYCKTAFSASAAEIKYEIATGTGASILTIPNNFMFDQGNTLIYRINQSFPVNTIFNAICSSTKAFGEIVVKLNFR